MRDRADLPQAHLALGIEVALAARLAAAGLVQQAEAETGDRARIGAAFQMIVLMLLDRAVEIETEIGPAIERVGRSVGIGQLWRDRGDLRQRRQREFRRGEEQVAIAALEARFGLQPCLLYTSPSPRD